MEKDGNLLESQTSCFLH